MRTQSSILVTLLAATLCGCGAEPAQFGHREELNELIPDVQTQIRHTLDSHFGSPVDMVAWERLPIQYHAATGVLADVEGSASDEHPGAELRVTLTTQNRPIAPGDDVTFLSGRYVNAPEKATVEAFNPDNGLLTIREDGFNPPPAVGDRIVIGKGQILKEGRHLYAENCQHCHGVSGNGQGPTAKYLNPLPRDYQLGIFKFTSTATPDKASRDDLKRTITEGIPGTYMPSFKLLTDNELQSIVEYVLWLSMRGEIENSQIKTQMADYSKASVEESIKDALKSDPKLSSSEMKQQVVDGWNEYLTEDWQEEFDDGTKFLAERWENAQLESAVVFPKTPRVADTPESRAHGREIFLSTRGQCVLCHGPQGLGDGANTVSVQKNKVTNEDYPLPGLYDDWGHPIKPRNLTRGIYRGGRRPIDLYRRIYAGIKGTPMIAFGTVLKDEEIWDVVNYVYSIPFTARELKPGEGADETIPAPAEVAEHVPAAAVSADTTN